MFIAENNIFPYQKLRKATSCVLSQTKTKNMIYLNEFRLGSYVKEIGENEFDFVTEIREIHPRIRGLDEDTYHFFTNK